MNPLLWSVQTKADHHGIWSRNQKYFALVHSYVPLWPYCMKIIPLIVYEKNWTAIVQTPRNGASQIPSTLAQDYIILCLYFVAFAQLYLLTHCVLLQANQQKTKKKFMECVMWTKMWLFLRCHITLFEVPY